MVAHMARPRISLCCENFGEFLHEAKLRCRAHPAVPEGMLREPIEFNGSIVPSTRRPCQSKVAKSEGPTWSLHLITLRGRRNLTRRQITVETLIELKGMVSSHFMSSSIVESKSSGFRGQKPLTRPLQVRFDNWSCPSFSFLFLRCWEFVRHVTSRMVKARPGRMRRPFPHRPCRR